MLLDTPSLYFRAYYGVPDSITAADGTPVNAIRGLLDFMARLIRDHMPTRVVAAMDADWRPKWRVDALPGYKGERGVAGGGVQTTGYAAVGGPGVGEGCGAVGECPGGVG